MRKFQLFLVVEALMITMALLQILSESLPRFVVMLVLILLAIKYYNAASRVDALLITGLLVFFFIVMINPFVIAAILLGVAYIVINHFSQVQKKNRFSLVTFNEESHDVSTTYQQWIGAHHVQGDSVSFEDINLIRLSGSDTIDLESVIVRGTDNVIVIRKIYGPTKILVPIDVAVQLNVASIYGSVTFLDKPGYDLRNASIKIASPDYDKSQKRVKIIVNTLAGPTEVMHQ